MKSLKHNKLKNTAIIFEVLATKMVSEVLDGVSTPKVLGIIKKHFNQKTILFKELALYKSLLMNKSVEYNQLDRYLDLVIESRKRLSDVALKTAKYNVIKEVKEKYGDDFILNDFNIKIRNYKEMASIYKLFEHDAVDNPAQILECRKVLTENLNKSDIEEIPVESEWASLSKDVRHLGFKRLIEKFNQKYDNLLPRQKKVLQAIINTPDKLKEIIEKEIIYIKEQLKKSVLVTDDATKVKLEQLPSLLENINTRKMTDEHVSIVLRSFQLLEELKA